MIVGRMIVGGMIVIMGRTAVATVARLRLGTSEGVGHDRPDRTRAAAAIRAAAQASIELGRSAGAVRAGTEARLDVTIGQQIAGANDHANVP
jgi:hypothetical protein